MQRRDENKQETTRTEVLLRRALAKAAFAASATVRPNRSWQQAAWFFDPQNVTGLASDQNDGSTALTPVRTYNGGILQRWDTYSPRLRQSTTITALSSHTDGSDPIICDAIMEAAGQLVFVGIPAAGTAGVLAGVVAKNRATPQQLTADAGVAGAQRLFMANTTRTAFNWIDTNTAGSTFVLTQPFAPALPATNSLSSPVEVNTYANADVTSIVTPIRLNIERINPMIADTPAALVSNLVTLWHIECLAVAGTGGKLVVIGDGVKFLESSTQPTVVLAWNTGALGGRIINSFVGGGLLQKGNGQLMITGGTVRGLSGCDVANAYFDGDAYVETACVMRGGRAALLCLPVGNVLAFAGDVDAQTAGLYGANILWGAGTYNVQGRNQLSIVAGGGSAAAEFPSAGTVLQLNGASSGHSVVSGAPDVTNAIGTLTPANIDAAAGVAGYGGLPFNYQGASMSKAGL